MRTQKVAKNLFISTILTTVVALVGLVKMKFFLNYLGAEATGLYQLFTQIFSYISLVDAGLTSSLLYFLYQPVHLDDTAKINSILKGARNFYNRVAILIIIIGFLLSFKIGFFISQYILPLRYIQICFILFITSNAINYLVVPRKIIMEAKQNLYKVHAVVYGTIIINGILEIILLALHFKLLSLMILIVGMAIVQNIIIIIVAKREYPQLTYRQIKPDNSFRKQTHNLLIQKIAGVVFNNIDIILISKYIGSASIVIYTSYMYVVNSLQNIIRKLGSSALASVGNLLVSEKEKSRSVFYEYNSLCFYIANLICVPLLIVITPFVALFYGPEFTLPYWGCFFVVLILYFKIIEIPLNVYNSALGYFAKVRNCVIFQSIINLVLSFALLFKYGIPGILLATIIAYLLGEFALYPRILNANHFKKYKLKYYSNGIKLSIISIISYGVLNLITKDLVITNLFNWFLLGVSCFIGNAIIVTSYYFLTKQALFWDRFKQFIFIKKMKGAK